MQGKNNITALLWIPNFLSPTRILPCPTNKMLPNERPVKLTDMAKSRLTLLLVAIFLITISSGNTLINWPWFSSLKCLTTVWLRRNRSMVLGMHKFHYSKLLQGDDLARINMWKTMTLKLLSIYSIAMYCFKFSRFNFLIMFLFLILFPGVALSGTSWNLAWYFTLFIQSGYIIDILRKLDVDLHTSIQKVCYLHFTL